MKYIVLLLCFCIGCIPAPMVEASPLLSVREMNISPAQIVVHNEQRKAEKPKHIVGIPAKFAAERLKLILEFLVINRTSILKLDAIHYDQLRSAMTDEIFDSISSLRKDLRIIDFESHPEDYDDLSELYRLEQIALDCLSNLQTLRDVEEKEKEK